MRYQDNQVILGVRTSSVKAFWNNGDGNRRRIQTVNDPQPEFVNIHCLEQSVLKIEWAFDNNLVAGSHFEFEFKERMITILKFRTFQQDFPKHYCKSII